MLFNLISKIIARKNNLIKSDKFQILSYNFVKFKADSSNTKTTKVITLSLPTKIYLSLIFYK